MRANTKPCPKCGGEMHRQSKMCAKCHAKQIAKPENYITKNCPVCGQEFTVHVCHIERGQGKYCSRSCARSGSPTRKKATPIVTCETCGSVFEKHQAEIDKNVWDLHFCSPECWYEYNQGENHYGWEGGQNERVNPDYTKWHRAVLERDHYFCRRCHSRRNLEVHHIKRFATHPDFRWEVSNGITLCHDCHVLFRNREEEYEEILTFMASIPVTEIVYVKHE